MKQPFSSQSTRWLWRELIVWTFVWLERQQSLQTPRGVTHESLYFSGRIMVCCSFGLSTFVALPLGKSHQSVKLVSMKTRRCGGWDSSFTSMGFQLGHIWPTYKSSERNVRLYLYPYLITRSVHEWHRLMKKQFLSKDNCFVKTAVTSLFRALAVDIMSSLKLVTKPMATFAVAFLSSSFLWSSTNAECMESVPMYRVSEWVVRCIPCCILTDQVPTQWECESHGIPWTITTKWCTSTGFRKSRNVKCCWSSLRRIKRQRARTSTISINRRRTSIGILIGFMSSRMHSVDWAESTSASRCRIGMWLKVRCPGRCRWWKIAVIPFADRSDGTYWINTANPDINDIPIYKTKLGGEGDIDNDYCVDGIWSLDHYATDSLCADDEVNNTCCLKRWHADTDDLNRCCPLHFDWKFHWFLTMFCLWMMLQIFWFQFVHWKVTGNFSIFCSLDFDWKFCVISGRRNCTNRSTLVSGSGTASKRHSAILPGKSVECTVMSIPSLVRERVLIFVAMAVGHRRTIHCFQCSIPSLSICVCSTKTAANLIRCQLMNWMIYSHILMIRPTNRVTPRWTMWWISA